jgi:hypothetical protein
MQRGLAYFLSGCLIVALIGVGLAVTRSRGKVETQRVRQDVIGQLVRQTRAGCRRATADRIDTARKDAADVLRERLLATMTSGAESEAHASSSRVALQAARGYLERAGIVDVRRPEAIVDLEPDSPGVRAARAAFCARAFPMPVPAR